MGILDLIKTRRSIRKYKSQDIPYEKILEILEAGIWAPSSGNLQNWYFIIVKDPEKRRKIMELSYGQGFILEAPVLIVICSDTNLVTSIYGEVGKMYAIQNTAAAIQNIMLAAWEKGYGTCWVGAFNEKEIKKILEIPDDIEIHAIITLGVPDENPKPPKRIGLYEKVFFERWGNKLYKTVLYPIIEKLEGIKKEFLDLKSKL